MTPAITMEKINEIWKAKEGRDLTTEEAWGMVEFVRMILENADKKLDKEVKIA